MTRCRFHQEENQRRKWHNPEAILTKIGLGSEMIFVDIGCGDGFFAIPAAKLVGEKGKIFAVDIDDASIEKLKLKAAENGLNNVIAFVRQAEEAILCVECADVIFFGIFLHDFEEPAKVLQNARRMIKPSGKLVNLDWKKKTMRFGPPKHIRFSAEEAINLIKQGGFEVKSVSDCGMNFYLIIAKP